jgi:hypothetical protein
MVSVQVGLTFRLDLETFLFLFLSKFVFPLQFSTGSPIKEEWSFHTTFWSFHTTF